MSGPRRIVCLTEEPTEVLYALGEQDRIVGISGFTVRPAIARREKPKVSAFTSAKIDEILRLEPDFVIGFSDIQADIASALIRRGVEVWISNHRSVEGILDYIRRLGALVGVATKADAYADSLREGLDAKDRVMSPIGPLAPLHQCHPARIDRSVELRGELQHAAEHRLRVDDQRQRLQQPE